MTKRNHGWPEDERVRVPEQVLHHFREGMGRRGSSLREDWMGRFTEYEAPYPELADHLYRMHHRQLPDGWDRIFRPLRLSALMELPVINIFTPTRSASVGTVPTHQLVEQLASLRTIPGLITIRATDANEVTEAWRVIMQLRHEPVALVLSRQALPTLDRTKYAPADGVAKGAYLLADSNGGLPEVIPLGSGSGVSLCVEAHEQLTREGVRFHVVRIIDRFRAVGPDVLEGRADPAILICGSGVGACVTANKIPGICAGLCHDSYSARQGVEPSVEERRM